MRDLIEGTEELYQEHREEHSGFKNSHFMKTNAAFGDFGENNIFTKKTIVKEQEYPPSASLN